VMWDENFYSLLRSGLNVVGHRCVQYGQTRLRGLWSFGRVERVSMQCFLDVF
jgi:hypothetical protein